MRAMRTFGTETTSAKVWMETGWTIVPHNVALAGLAFDCEAPLSIVTALDEEGTGRPCSLVTPTRRTRIDDETHQRLLDESISEYGEIWRTLADR